MLEQIISSITKHPRNMLYTAALLASCSFSITSTLIGLILFMFLHLIFKIPVWLTGLIAILLIMLSVVFDGISWQTVHHQNHITIHSIFHHNFTVLTNTFIWLTSVPYALLIAVAFSLISNLKMGLHDEVKRVGKGKGQRSKKIISAKKLQLKLSKLNSSASEDGTIIGIDVSTADYVKLTDKDANLHTLAIGTTGSGKTTGIANIIESAVVRGHPLFYVDGKGDFELAKRVEQFAKSQNVPFYLFSMVGESVKYNPIAFGGFTSKKDRIVELRHWSEDHYRKLAEGYLQTVFKILDTANINIDLNSLAKHLAPNELYLLARQLGNQELIKDIEKIEPKYKDISSLIAEIENLSNSEIGHLFDCQSGNALTLDEALAQHAVVYFCLQPLAFPAYAETLGKLIINDIKSLVASLLRINTKIKLFTIFDEFSVFAGDQIVNLINQGRGAGVHAVLSTQSLSDITKKGGDALLGQVLNNVNNYIIQRQNNPQDAEVLANLIGTETGFQVTSQLIVNQLSSNLGSVRESREFIVHPDDIKRLGLGQAVFLNKQEFGVWEVRLRMGVI